MKKEKKNQPENFPNAGCIFKNPKKEMPAGKLIDLANLKGRKQGGARISNTHANFILNYNNASTKDILDLINIIQKKVKEKFNITLEKEIQIV